MGFAKEGRLTLPTTETITSTRPDVRDSRHPPLSVATPARAAATALKGLELHLAVVTQLPWRGGRSAGRRQQSRACRWGCCVALPEGRGHGRVGRPAAARLDHRVLSHLVHHLLHGVLHRDVVPAGEQNNERLFGRCSPQPHRGRRTATASTPRPSRPSPKRATQSRDPSAPVSAPLAVAGARRLARVFYGRHLVVSHLHALHRCAVRSVGRVSDTPAS